MREFIVFIIMFGCVAGLAGLYRRDRQRERARIRDLAGPEVCAEIAAERAAAERRHGQFEAALHDAKRTLGHD